jgi:hypothetical protein
MINSQNRLNVAMIRTRLLGISSICILLAQISCIQSDYYYSRIKKVNVENFNTVFSEYCRIDSSNSYQKSFTLCSFFGDYKGALHFATKEAVRQKQYNGKPNLSPVELEDAKQELNRLLTDSSKFSLEQHVMVKILRSVINSNKDVKDVFKYKTHVSASEYIVNNSSKYHFLLLNEAHYSSQNRAFTRALLRPLWEKGYRFLALEALGYTDTKLIQRGYPITSTGYYTNESVFGNLVREALLIGYKLVPYESKNSSLGGTERDMEQALNIYNATLRNDSVGKVIVHAGYSHISEFPGHGYSPMGFQLGKLAHQPIFTIDQNVMTELDRDEVMHSYYRFATDAFEFDEPVIFLNNEGLPLVDPINEIGIDAQVYHPKTTYIHGRPSWLLTKGHKAYELSKELKEFSGHLVQVVITNEDSLSVPVDQVVVEKDIALILKPGSYTLRIIDCKGTLIGKATLETH